MPGPHISMRQTRRSAPPELAARAQPPPGQRLGGDPHPHASATRPPPGVCGNSGIGCTDSIGTGVRTRSEWVYGNHRSHHHWKVKGNQLG